MAAVTSCQFTSCAHRFGGEPLMEFKNLIEDFTQEDRQAVFRSFGIDSSQSKCCPGCYRRLEVWADSLRSARDGESFNLRIGDVISQAVESELMVQRQMEERITLPDFLCHSYISQLYNYVVRNSMTPMMFPMMFQQGWQLPHVVNGFMPTNGTHSGGNTPCDPPQSGVNTAFDLSQIIGSSVPPAAAPRVEFTSPPSEPSLRDTVVSVIRDLSEDEGSLKRKSTAEDSSTSKREA